MLWNWTLLSSVLSTLTTALGARSKRLNKSLALRAKGSRDLSLNDSSANYTSTYNPNTDTIDLNYTYIPPAATDITPELLEESLAVQSQDTATVASIVPYFQDGVITFGVQLDGFIASTLTLNASTSLSCGTIGLFGSDPTLQPALSLGPQNLLDSTEVAYIPDCMIIAVNMYVADIVTYWVQKPDGSIYSLLGSNKLVNIGRLNSTAGTSLVLKTTDPHSGSFDEGIVWKGDKITGRAKEIFTYIEHGKRGLSFPDAHSATYTKEACEAIKCNGNGGLAAVFNPFTATCWCRDPVAIVVDRSG